VFTLTGGGRCDPPGAASGWLQTSGPWGDWAIRALRSGHEARRGQHSPQTRSLHLRAWDSIEIELASYYMHVPSGRQCFDVQSLSLPHGAALAQLGEQAGF
jgi:hypothetical protein